MKPSQTDPTPSAYGGPGWSARNTSRSEELGEIWGPCGISSEWSSLQAVLLHEPGPEIEAIEDPNLVQFVTVPDPDLARAQHTGLVQAYRDAGVSVSFVRPASGASPNLMFAADLFFMTPEGAILGRPASKIRAGEEVHIARKLADMGIPILASVGDLGTFEGADAAWLAPNKVLLATGLRTNTKGATQVRDALGWLGVETIFTQLPEGVMHLMGVLRFGDRDLAITWPGRLAENAINALTSSGFRIKTLPNIAEAKDGHALNFVTLGPGRILAPAGNPATLSFYQCSNLDVVTVDVSELTRAAGAIGCLTGILERLSH